MIIERLCYLLYATAKIEERKNRRKNNYEIKNELLISLIDGDIVENEELNLRSDNVAYCQVAILIVKEYETIIN